MEIEEGRAVNWWQKLPSLTPIKGIVKFLHVWTNWDTISEELKKRDDRPKAVEETMRQLLDLEREKHEAEKARVARDAEQERQRLIALGGKAIDQALSALARSQATLDALREAYVDAAYAVSVLLAVEENEHVRNVVLSKLLPTTREIVRRMLDHLNAEKATLTPPPLQSHEGEG